MDCPTPCAQTVFNDLVKTHRHRLVRFVRGMVHHDADAEDLAQQALADAALGWAQFRGDSQPSTWLYGIALNLARNHLRRSPGRRHAFESEDILSDTPCERPGPAQRLESGQLMDLLQHELRRLEPAVRELLWMVSVDELPYDAVAERMAIPVGTVRSRVSRARSQLRKRFGHHGAALSF